MGRLREAETGSTYVPHETIAEEIASYTDILQRHQAIERGVIPERRETATVLTQSEHSTSG